MIELFRKRPSWETDEVPETEAERKKRKELEEWEGKMREVTRREREKWKRYGTNDRSVAPSVVDDILMPLDDDEKRPVGTGIGENESSPANYSGKKEALQNKSRNTKEELETASAEAPTEWKKGLQNGRWGMSIMEPAAPEIFENTPTTPQKSSLMSRNDEQTTLPTKSFNGRWGMSIKEAPRDFLNDVPVEVPHAGSSDILMRQDSVPAHTKKSSYFLQLIIHESTQFIRLLILQFDDISIWS